ncbi:MAG TPA: type III-A CRISPR-associated RAMP protein Csm5 [Syntrophorhabdaceae bacterium]|nr:type III-A CRISPR-associated RAMP protein Csm5 [Syntrophorhabdaceae bacterium]
MEKPLKIRLRVLSPIHIGCDDAYEPTSFVIDENQKKLIHFDPADFIKKLTPEQRSKFIQICSEEALLPIFKFVKQAFNQGIPGRRVDIAAGLLEHYRDMLKKSSYNQKEIINQFTINRTAYNPQTNKPYIPGTSIKGAIRTAYLNYLAANNTKKNAMQNLKNIEIELLMGKFDTDPLRMVKVSDLQPVEQVQTKIVYGVNKKKEISDSKEDTIRESAQILAYGVNKKKEISDRATRASSGPLQIFEVIESGVVFEGVINIDKPEKTSGIKTPIDQATLFKAIHQHYSKLYEQENVSIKKCGFKQLSLDSYLEGFGKTYYLIRLGRHSGAEAVTIEGYRKIHIRQAKKILDHSTTLWLASEFPRPKENNGLTPFGWAMLEVLPFNLKEPLYSEQENISSTIDTFEQQITEQDINQTAKPVEKKEPEKRTIPNVTLTYNPGNRLLSTTVEGKKAFIDHIDDKFIPEELWPKLKKDKKIKGSIVVEPMGNAFRIVKFIKHE